MTDWHDSEKAKGLKAKYIADAIGSCGQAVKRQRDLTPEERVDLTLRCTREALDTLDAKSEFCEVEAREKWFLKGRAHDRCLVNKVVSHPFDADQFVQQQADEVRAKSPGMNANAAGFKMMPEEFQAYKAREAEETAATLREAGRVLRNLAVAGTPPPACHATADPDVSPEDVRKALHCLEEAQKALSPGSYRKFLEVCTSDLPPTALTALGFTTESVAALSNTRAALKKAQRALAAASRQKFRDFCSALLPPAVRDALGFTPAAATPARPPPPRSRLAGGDNPPPSGEAPPHAVSAKARALVIPESTSSPDAVLVNRSEGTIEDEVRFNLSYEPLDEEKLHFEAAHPISPTDAVITRKFSLLPSMELPEEVKLHLKQVVTAFYNGGAPATRHLWNAYFDVCFAQFQHLVNLLIREGLRLPPVVKINVQQKNAMGKVIRDAQGKPVMKEVDHEVFAKDTTYAEKRFGEFVIKKARAALGQAAWLKRLQQIDPKADFHLHNRVERCAGAVAYHIVRNYRSQWMLVSTLVETLQTPLTVRLKGKKAGKASSLGRLVRALYEEELRNEEEETKAVASVTIAPLATLFDRQFPPVALVVAAREKLKEKFKDQELPKGYLNFIFLRNLFRYLRNLLRQASQTGPMRMELEDVEKYRAELATKVASTKARSDLEGAVVTWLAQPHVSEASKGAKTKVLPTKSELEFQLDSYLRRLSARLTKRVRFLLRRRKDVAKKEKKGKKRTFGEGPLDPLIQDILTRDHRTFAGIASAKIWQKSRQKWRDQAYDSLYGQLSVTDIDALVREVVQQVKMAPDAKFLRQVFDLRPSRTAFLSGNFAEFLDFLRAQLQAQAEETLLEEFYGAFKPYLLRFLEPLRRPPQFAQLMKLPFFKRPCYTGRGIPTAQAQDQKVCDIAETGSAVMVTLKLEADFPLQLRLATVRRRKNPAQGDRYRPFIDAEWTRRPGTLLKTPGGGLLLAIPFSKSLKTQAPVSRQAQMPAHTAGLDLGLKDFGALSIFEGDQEIARQFLDQWQLVGPRTAWFLPPDLTTPKAVPPPFFNWKNRLRFLRQEAASAQAQLADYKNEARAAGLSSKRFHHKRKFQELRRAWKRGWRKLTRLHEELARQIATRVVAYCEYYQVAVLRVEDLRWARHKPKAQAGYFLTANQIHWFHGQIQQRINDLAQRVGLRMERVNARDTSKACAHCASGKLGTRDGKRFVHQECPRKGGKPFQLDADLNAARNIARALPRGLASD